VGKTYLIMNPTIRGDGAVGGVTKPRTQASILPRKGFISCEGEKIEKRGEKGAKRELQKELCPPDLIWVKRTLPRCTFCLLDVLEKSIQGFRGGKRLLSCLST